MLVIPRTGSGRCDVLRDVSTHKLSDHFPVMSWLQTGQQQQTFIYSSHAPDTHPRGFSPQTHSLHPAFVPPLTERVSPQSPHTAPGRGVLTKKNSGLMQCAPTDVPTDMPTNMPTNSVHDYTPKFDGHLFKCWSSSHSLHADHGQFISCRRQAFQSTV